MYVHGDHSAPRLNVPKREGGDQADVQPLFDRHRPTLISLLLLKNLQQDLALLGGIGY
jgi:hypothetical protein